MAGSSSGTAAPILSMRVETPAAEYQREVGMLFMVIENFRNQDAKAVYDRFRDKGRLTPDGLRFVNSWVTADLSRCFQLMETDDVTLLQRWVAEWSDLIGFEIISVAPGTQTARALSGPERAGI